MPIPIIRLATLDDLPDINCIYNFYVAHSVTTYQEDRETIEDRRRWFAQHGPAHPVTVALLSKKVVGWASLSPFHQRSAYRRTVENSVYVDPAYLGQGFGSALLKDSITRARDFGHHTIVAGIDSEQTTSLALHRKYGFTAVAHLKQVGFKFGRWLDVIYLQKMLDT